MCCYPVITPQPSPSPHPDVRVCQHCVSDSVGDEMQFVCECTHPQAVWREYGHLVSPALQDMPDLFNHDDKVVVVNFILAALALLNVALIFYCLCV